MVVALLFRAQVSLISVTNGPLTYGRITMFYPSRADR